LISSASKRTRKATVVSADSCSLTGTNSSLLWKTKNNNYRGDDDVSAVLLTEHQGVLSHRGKRLTVFFFNFYYSRCRLVVDF
jgi:hypothetical protein